MKRTAKNITALLLAAILVLLPLLIAACSCSSDELDPETPDTGYSDKSDLAYGEALESYKKTDFTASWIWTKSTAEDSYVAFRKTFNLDGVPGKVTAYASAESKYFMWVNGRLTVYDGSVKRGPTPYDAYFDEITVDNLKTGSNTLAFLVPYNGRSGDSSVDGALALGEGDTQGGFIFEMKAGESVIKSDHTFKAKRLSEYKNRITLGAAYPAYSQTSMLAERNMWYDARESAGDYTAEAFDDTSWESATLIAKPGALPFGDLYSSQLPLASFGNITDCENSAKYVGKTLSANTTLTLDLPKNRQFSAYFEMEAPAGKKLTYYTDTFQIGTTASYSFKDTYVTKEGAQAYESYPWRSGSKLIIEAEAGVKFTKIGYRPSGYASEISGKFESSNADLNKLWTMSANTIEICMRDSFIDCPERERGPYMGDAANEIDISYYAMDVASHALVRKSILACVGWTGKDNLIPSRAPSSKPHEIPVQSLAFSTAAYNYWLQTGDAETMKAYYTVLVNYLKVWKMKENEMPEYRSGEWTWTDWGSGIDTELIQVCWYYYSMSCAKKLAADFGITADNAFFNERMSGISENFDALYKKTDGFRSGNAVDDRANAMAVVSGLAGEDDYALVTEALRSIKKASPYMERFVLEALCKMGQYELAMNRITDRYGKMISSGDTTVWELFDRDEGTINHGWAAGPLLVMSGHFGGIAPASAGYASYEIKPQNLFYSLDVSTDTLKGTIGLKYVKSGGTTTFTIKTIAAEGLIKIPHSFGTIVSGTGFTNLGTENGCTVLKITAGGTYTITVS